MQALSKILILLLLSSVALASPSSFNKSKKLLAKHVYFDHQKSFYCGCDYSLKPKAEGSNKMRLTPNWSSCGYKPRKQPKRASRIEWEHIMPAHHFGQHMQCWRSGGRKACKKDSTFKAMEADMHNLVPAIGEVNGDRSNSKFGILEGEKRVYGACDLEIDFKAKRAEPAESVRGDIARIYFYMSEKYKIRLSKQQRKLLKAWDKSDPVDAWEIERDKRISEVQGNSNPFVVRSP